jgi:uncharacterized protein (TIGR02646 family)
LLKWKSDNRASPHNLAYGGGGFPAEKVRQALLAEQFHLCAYTMKKLRTAQECRAQGQDTTHSCHIEHVLPQARKIPAETIDYHNMVACFPPSASKVACEYGAHAKADYDPETQPFVSPLGPSVERHFKFDGYGGVTGLTPAGQATVEVLRLDHPTLCREREAVIKGFLEPRTRKKLSAAQARRLAEIVLQPDERGCLPPFCIAVHQAAIAHAEREERRAARMKKKATP